MLVGRCKTPHPALGADGAWDSTLPAGGGCLLHPTSSQLICTRRKYRRGSRRPSASRASSWVQVGCRIIGFDRSGRTVYIECSTNATEQVPGYWNWSQVIEPSGC